MNKEMIITTVRIPKEMNELLAEYRKKQGISKGTLFQLKVFDFLKAWKMESKVSEVDINGEVKSDSKIELL